jgi:hypothetical protein
MPNIVYRITLEGHGGATLDQLCREALKIQEAFGIDHLYVIHNNVTYHVQPQTPYAVTETSRGKKK